MLEEDGYQMIIAFLKYCKFSNKISFQIMEASQITGQVKNIKSGWSKFIMTYISYFTFFKLLSMKLRNSAKNEKYLNVKHLWRKCCISLMLAYTNNTKDKVDATKINVMNENSISINNRNSRSNVVSVMELQDMEELLSSTAN